MMDVEAKRARQRLHVKRSYYRKLERISGIRSQVEQLTQQHRIALACQQQQQALAPYDYNGDMQPRQRAVQLYVEASRLKEQLHEENQKLRKLLDEKERLRVKLQNSCEDFNDLTVGLTRALSLARHACACLC